MDRHGCQPVWSGATGGRHLIHVHGKVLGACRLVSGGPSDRRHVVQLAPPLPAPGRRLSPWGGVVLVRGQERLQRELLMAPALTQPTLSVATGAPRSTATRCAVNIHDVNSKRHKTGRHKRSTHLVEPCCCCCFYECFMRVYIHITCACN